MSWGYRVIIILVLFVIGIVSMVFIANRQTNEMVDDNYYEKEMKYQGVIDAKENLQRFNDSILVVQEGDIVKIIMPAAASKNITEGNIEFLRSADKLHDRNIAIKTDSLGALELPKTDFVKGIYRMRANWVSNGKPFYYEKDVIIQ